jgi:4-amino-4-deoxy-L-arabinose transferase-like glycosyltransferase
VKNFNKNLLLFIILALSIFWRFYNYQNRWTLQQDQARDAIIGQYLLKTQQIPLLGPPSSAGDFSFGPIYYFVIIFFTTILPFVNGPWIGFTILSVLSVIIFFYLGKKIGGLSFAVVLGLVAAFCSASVFHSSDLLNPQLLSFFIPLSMLSLFFSLQKDKLIYPIITGFAIGAAINAHLQALVLVTFIILPLIFKKEKKIKMFLGSILGLGISFLPLIYFDIKNNGAWIKSIIEYITVGQNKFNISYSFISDLTIFWPSLWGEVIAGIPLLGYFLVAIFLLAFFISKIKKQFFNFFWIIFLSFVFQVIILKFYKGPRLPVYLILHHSFIVFLVAWSLWIILRFNKILGLIFIIFILSFSSYSNFKIINNPSQTPAIYKLKEKIENLRKEDKQVLSFRESNGVSLPLYYLWLREGKISNGGVKLGVCRYSIQRGDNLSDYITNCPDDENLIVSFDEYKVFDLSKKSDLGNLDYLTEEKIYNWVFKRYD